MDREDIIKLAREAGLAHFYDSEGHCSGITDARLVTEGKEQNDDRLVEMLAPFAALVAAAEREKVAAWMIQRSYATGHGDTTEDQLKELDWQIDERIAAEREACAKVCEDAISGIGAFYPEYVNQVSRNVCTNLAATIRARGRG